LRVSVLASVGEKSGVLARMHVAGPKLMLRRHAMILALLLASVAAVGRAEACTVGGSPSTSASNATVDCSGITKDSSPNGKNGYGTANDDNNTYNIHAGATVTGDVTSGGGFGLVFGTGATFNNSGTITGFNVGINGGDATINNISTPAGTAVISGFNGVSVRNLILNNTGRITATGDSSDALHVLTANVASNTGTIEALGVDGIAIRADAVVTVTGNAGFIDANNTGGIAIKAFTVNIHSNDGTISATGAGGVGILAGTVNSAGAVNVTANAGTISGGLFGIESTGTVDVTANTGTISGDTAIQAGTIATIKNAGKILGGGGSVGINAGTANIVNFSSGTISAGASGVAITADIANVNNFGTISAGLGGTAIFAFDRGAAATVINSRTISADGGIAIETLLGSATVTNTSTGTISGGFFAIFAATGDATVGNAGTIQATNALGDAILANGLADVTNSGSIIGGANGIFARTAANVTNMRTGTISGNIAIQALGAGGIGSTITTSGAIISTAGASGTAIKLSAAADTLNLKLGSQIVGKIDMGFNTADVINVEATTGSPGRGLSTLTRSAAGVVEALKAQLVNFDGVINTILISLGAGGQPSVTVGGVTASLDPTALAQADRALMDFTGGVSSMVQGRLGSPAGTPGAPNVQMMSYAMEEAPATGVVSGALGYAPDNADRTASTPMFAKAPAASWGAAPVTVWSSGFAGQRVQDAADATLRSTSTAYGGAIGLDRKVRPDWLLGAFVGGGAGRLSVDLSSQTVDTDYVFAGVYSRFEWGAQFVDVTVQGGSARNKSSRLIQNTIAGTLDHATSSNNGWFISPEIAYGYRYALGNGYVLTPTARLRYVAGLFDGYSETGSAQTLSVGSRTLQDFEERGELDLSRVTTFFGGDHSLKTNLHGGVIALQRAGDTNVNAVLIGQNLAFTTPGKGSTVGAVAGAAFDYHVNPNVALFGAVEGIAMSDQSRIITAKGGVRAAF
jgi:Autotransporter beta-domain